MKRERVGVVGAGLMGAGMAGCLLRAGHPVVVVAHRNRDPVDRLLKAGAAESPDPGAVLGACDVLLTCVPNADVVGNLADDLAPRFAEGQLWIDVTTSRPEVSRDVAARLAERGAVFADAPVTGGPPQAEEGTLASLVGCDSGEFGRVESLVGAYSKVVRHFGGVGSGHAAKLLNNLVTQGTMLLLADAYQCAAELGVDGRALYDVMMAGAARSGTLEKAVGPSLDGKYDGMRFTVANAVKDLSYAHDLISACGSEGTETAAALAERGRREVERGRGNLFVSELLRPPESGDSDGR